MTAAGLNITDALADIIGHAVSNSPQLIHIDMKRILVCVSSNRGRGMGGIYGKLVPLRFMNGHDITEFKGKRYAIPHLYHNDERILYLIYFYMPKFFDLPPLEKLNVIFHELFHISPMFNGDIRRMGKVKSAHGFSKKNFDMHFSLEVGRYHDAIRSSDFYGFLEMNSTSLHRSFKKIYARRIPIPRPVLLDNRPV